jgi:hypothetical protein
MFRSTFLGFFYSSDFHVILVVLSLVLLLKSGFDIDSAISFVVFYIYLKDLFVFVQHLFVEELEVVPLDGEKFSLFLQLFVCFALG